MHSNADVSTLQGRGVVDTIAGHANHVAPVLEAAEQERHEDDSRIGRDTGLSSACSAFNMANQLDQCSHLDNLVFVLGEHLCEAVGLLDQLLDGVVSLQQAAKPVKVVQQPATLNQSWRSRQRVVHVRRGYQSTYLDQAGALLGVQQRADLEHLSTHAQLAAKTTNQQAANVAEGVVPS